MYSSATRQEARHLSQPEVWSVRACAKTSRNQRASFTTYYSESHERIEFRGQFPYLSERSRIGGENGSTDSPGLRPPQRHGKASQGGCAGISPLRNPAGRSPPADALHGRGLCGVPQATRRILPPLRPLLDLVPDWEAFIGKGEDESFSERLRGHACVCRPLARSLKRKKPGLQAPRAGSLHGRPVRRGRAELGKLFREFEQSGPSVRGPAVAVRVHRNWGRTTFGLPGGGLWAREKKSDCPARRKSPGVSDSLVFRALR